MNRDTPPSIQARRIGIRRGFTLVEAIVAVVVLALAIPPMMVSVRDASVRRVDPLMISRARWVASERLEDVIADRHAAARGWSYVVSTNYPAETSISGFPGFSRSTSIRETGPTLTGSGTGYKIVNVVVSWRAPGGTKNLSLATVLTDYTP